MNSDTTKSIANSLHEITKVKKDKEDKQKREAPKVGKCLFYIS